ncbi:MAG: FAD-dependent oxidoreductase [Litorimonas sp.]
MKTNFDIIIVGAGLVGLTAAIACAQSGLSIAVIDRRARADMPADYRASAIAASSMRMLERLGVELSEQTQPIHDMVAYEGMQSEPWKVHFDAPDKLGAMIENTHLQQALWAAFDSLHNVHMLAPAQITDHSHDIGGVTVSLADTENPLTAKLLIAADGHGSYMRRAAGITVQKTDYEQRALVAIVKHSLPHDGVAVQRFMHGGPLAVLPLPNNRSQIVWSNKSGAATTLEHMDETDFLAILSEKMGEYLGGLSLETPRQSYPLRLQIADAFSADRLALIGDAAHVIHPLAGQGLNLGLRDVAALSEGIGLAKTRGQDIGVAGLLDYSAWRNTDIRAMGAATHSLNVMFGAKNPLIGHIRRLGMKAINDISPLKKIFIQNAAGDLGDLPAIMRN